MAGVNEPTGGLPEDVVTGFWLWVSALPLLVAGQIVDMVASPVKAQSWFVYAISGLFVAIVAAVVLTFLILMRYGYRWTRTLLTGGGATTVVYVATSLLTTHRTDLAALVYAVTAIVGSVLIGGGAYLLHRKDAHAFFTK